jgi:hypothetical protein
MPKARAAYIAWLLAAPAVLPAIDHADDANNAKAAESVSEPSVDADLLEYLGTVDAEGQEWMEFLAHTDIAQVAKAKKPPVTAEAEEK